MSEISIDFDKQQSISEFLNHLEKVPWFQNIDKETAPNESVQRIRRWEEWPGPEKSFLVELSCSQQDLYDEIISGAGHQSTDLIKLWDHIHAVVFRNASSKIPYDDNRDTWFGPTAAVWQAAWTAGLIGLCLYLRRPLPTDLLEQWKWFLNGHWPCGLVEDLTGQKLLIY
jgi:hypothetical protein